MKKIINGKLYNTETATEKGYWCNSSNSRDLDFCSETLYLKKTGEFFLHGEGGAMSKYSESLGNNSWGGGEKIIPLTYDSAKDWAEENLGAVEYEEIFGAVVEDESQTALTVRVSVTAAETLKRISRESGRTIGDILNDIILGGK